MTKFQQGWKENQEPTTTLEDLKKTLESKPEDFLDTNEELEAMAELGWDDARQAQGEFEEGLDDYAEYQDNEISAMKGNRI